MAKQNETNLSPVLVAASNVLAGSGWSSPAARSRGMRDLALAQVGSASLDQARIATRYVELTTRRVLSIALRAARLEPEARCCKRTGDAASAVAAARAVDAAHAAYARVALSTAAAHAASLAAYDVAAAHAAAAAGAYATAAAHAAHAVDAATLAYAAAVADDRIRVLSASLLVQAITEARGGLPSCPSAASSGQRRDASR